MTRTLKERRALEALADAAAEVASRIGLNRDGDAFVVTSGGLEFVLGDAFAVLYRANEVWQDAQVAAYERKPRPSPRRKSKPKAQRDRCETLASELLSLGCLSPSVRVIWEANLRSLVSIKSASAERSRVAAERGRGWMPQHGELRQRIAAAIGDERCGKCSLRSSCRPGQQSQCRKDVGPALGGEVRS